MAKLTRWLSGIAAVALALITVLTVVDIVVGNVFGRPITGVYEVVGTALVFVVFLGIPETFRAEQNITVDVLDHFVPPGVTAALRMVGAALSLALLALMQWAMIAPAADAIRFGDIKSDSGIPVWVQLVPALLGTAIAIVCAGLALARVVRQSRAGAKSP
ncbi:MAG: TRAP transporter small permease [Betaproteobacteria bacterium]|nr:TRAP transporter small permease [Betaproteobacteria bacterium]